MTIVDDYEDADLSEYSESGQGEGDIVSTAAVGDHALEILNVDTTTQSEYVVSTEGLPAYPQAGDTFEVYLSLDDPSDNNGFFWFAVQSETVDPERYVLKLDGDDNELQVFYADGDGGKEVILATNASYFKSISEGYLRFEIDWTYAGSRSGFLNVSGETAVVGSHGDHSYVYAGGDPVRNTGAGPGFFRESGTPVDVGGSGVDITVRVYDGGTKVDEAAGSLELDGLPTTGGIGGSVSSYFGYGDAATYVDHISILD